MRYFKAFLCLAASARSCAPTCCKLYLSPKTLPATFQCFLVIAFGGVISSSETRAGITIEIHEVGPNLHFDVLAGGALNFDGWSKVVDGAFPLPTINQNTSLGNHHDHIFGFGEMDTYTRGGVGDVIWSGTRPVLSITDNSGNSSPNNWGWGARDFPDASKSEFIYVPNNYVSKSVLPTTQTFVLGGFTFTDLGTGAGNSWTATLGGTGDTIAFVAVPEPSGLLLGGLLLGLSLSWRRKM